MILFALLACVPDTFDVSADDYLTRKPSPDAMVNADGVYNGGWFDSFDGTINPEDSIGRAGAFKGWLHFSLQNDDRTLSVNLADMNNVGNTAITVLDNATGEQHVHSINDAFGKNAISLNADFTESSDANNGNFIRVVDGGQRLEFDVSAGDIRIAGSAAKLFSDEFVQISRFHDGYGQLQWYGKLQVESATLTLPEGEIALGSETLGAYDRMAGHRRTAQAWNWVTTVGPAVRESDGAEVMIGVEITTEREGSQPLVDTKKHGVWIGDTFKKIPSANFTLSGDYEVVEPGSDWTIASDDGDEDRVDLVFHPQAVRTDEVGYLWFYYTDFHQFSGRVSGTIEMDGEIYTIDDLPALAEDSSLIL